MSNLSCFKAYDIRGKLEIELNEEIAYKIGRAYGDIYMPQTIAVGADIRLSSETLKQALIAGLNDAGVNVLDLGMTGTEEVYFAAFHLNVQGGIEVTASHNPIDYNGMKLVKENARPISMDSGLKEIHDLVVSENFKVCTHKGKTKPYNIVPEYIDHLLKYINLTEISPLKIVVNAGNGAAGHIIDALEERFIALNVPITFIKIHHEADGTFPNGIPNPLLIENRSATSQAVLQYGADLGIAWDGDFDRCFLFDEAGEFIEGYYIVGLLAQTFLMQHPGEKIVYDPRLIWNTIDIVNQYNGQAIQSKAGHAFIKEIMRENDAVYGGEMSAHHYFRDFSYCDSGMIPWLLVVSLLSSKKEKLSTLVNGMMQKYPCSGEINFKVEDPQKSIQTVLKHFSNTEYTLDTTDGVSLDFGDWRFNLRASNTEPLLRLNVECCDTQENITQLLESLKKVIK